MLRAEADKPAVDRVHPANVVLTVVPLLCAAILLRIVRRPVSAAVEQRGRKRLSRSLARVDAVVRNFSDVVIVIDLDGRICYLNDSADRALDYPHDSLLGRSVLDIVVPADHALVDTLRQRLRSGSEPLPEFELRVRQHGGAWRYFGVAGTPLVERRRRRCAILTLRDVTKQKRTEQRLTHQALHDPVTGLPNRALFMDRLEQALAAARQARRVTAVMFLDLDRFKVINDTLGHAVGDHLLIAVAQRLSHCLPVDGLFARFGGDEFAILLSSAPDPSAVEDVATRVVEALRLPLQLAGHEVVVSASVGVAFSTPDLSHSSDLLRDADVALYRAKRDGGGAYVVFDRYMNSLSADRLDLEADLRRAIEREEFELYYQPDVDLTTGQISGVEALIRWHHPTRGLRSPAEFVPLAEETGLILPIGEWVLQAACAQARRWQATLPRNMPFVMSLNLSARQFDQADLPQRIAGALAGVGLDAACLKLEITESILMQETDATIRTLRALRELGVRLAIDDFGTGYSSFSYLRRFPVDTVKIDQSFVRELGRDRGSSAIVEAIARVAHALDMDVTAEGIESQIQLDLAAEYRCDRGQGYFFSEPIPARAATEILRDGGASWIPRPTVSFQTPQLELIS